jgi:hypothetical protein
MKMRRDAGKKRPRATKTSDAELDSLIEEVTATPTTNPSK